MMGDITKDFQSVKEMFGKIGMSAAEELLDEINLFLKNTPDNFSQLNAKYFSKFDKKIPIEKIESMLNAVRVLDDDTVGPNPFNYLQVDDVVNLDSLLNVVKQFAMAEKKFLLTTYTDAQKSHLDPNKIKLMIDKNKRAVSVIEDILSILQMSINTIDEKMKNDFEDLKIDIGKCANDLFMFEVQQNEYLMGKKIENEKLLLKRYQRILGDGINVTSDKLMQNESEMERMNAEFKVNDVKGYLDAIENHMRYVSIIKNLGYLNEIANSPLKIDDNLNRLYKKILLPLSGEYFGKINATIDEKKNYDSNTIIKHIFEIKSVLKKYNILDNTDFYDNCKKLISPYLESVAGMCNTRLEYYKQKKIYEHKIIATCKKIISVNKKAKITLTDVQDTIVPNLRRDVLTGQTIVNEKAKNARDGIYMLFFYYIRPDTLFENLEKYDKMIGIINDDVKNIKVNMVDEKMRELSDKLDRYKKLNERGVELEDDVKLLKSDELPQKIRDANENIIMYERDRKEGVQQLKKNIDEDLTTTIEIFRMLIERNKMLEDFYAKSSDGAMISTSDLVKSFDPESRSFVGGTLYNSGDFVEILNKNFDISGEIQQNLSIYCQTTSVVKSKYTAMYNGLRNLNKMVADMILFNLFKLTTYRDVCNDVIKINRFINRKDIIVMRDAIDNFLMTNKRSRIFELVGNRTKILFKRVIDYMEKNNISDDRCCDIMSSNYVIDFVLGSRLYLFISFFSKRIV